MIKKEWIMAVAVVTVASMTQAQDTYKYTNTGNWTNAANWKNETLDTTGTVPPAGNNANYLRPDGVLSVTSDQYSGAARLGILRVGANGSAATLRLENKLYADQLLVGHLDNYAGVVDVVSGRLDVPSAHCYVGFTSGASATLNISGGIVWLQQKWMRVGWNGSTGVVHQTDGTVWAGRVEFGTWNASYPNSSGTYNLHGGQLNLSDSSHWGLSKLPNGEGEFNIQNDGVLAWTGNQVSNINNLVTAGTLTWTNGGDVMLTENYEASYTNGSHVLYLDSDGEVNAFKTTAWVVDLDKLPPENYELLIDYPFNDAADTQMTGLVNDGPLSAPWDTDTPGIMFADGVGNVTVVTNVQATPSPDPDADQGDTKSIAVLSEPLTNGWALLEWRVDGWDTTGISTNGGFAIEALSIDGGVTNVVSTEFYMRWGGTEMRIRNEGPAGQGSVFGFPVSSTDGLGLRMLFDLTSGDVRFLYNDESTADGWLDTGVSGVANGIGRIDQIVFSARGGLWANNPAAYVNVDYLTLSEGEYILAAEEMYAEWLAGYPGVGSETGLSDNPDGDALDNLAEYALGGNPDNAADIGIASVVQDEGGWFYFVHAQRKYAAERGLVYDVVKDVDLVYGDFTNTNVEVVGTNTSYVVGFDAVTNRVPSDALDQQFLKLEIEANF
jgi:hypothetical protein